MNLLNQITDVSSFIFNKDLSEGASGNISFAFSLKSAKIYSSIKLLMPLKSIAGESYAITATGSRVYELAESPKECLSLVKVSSDGKYLHLLNDLKPSSEILCHLLAYEAGAKKKNIIKAIIHVHPKYSLALSNGMTKKNLNSLLDKTHTEFKYYFPNGIGFVNRTDPGTLLLAKKNAEESSKHSVVVWENHGMIASGNDFYECYDKLDTIESISKIAVLSR